MTLKTQFAPAERAENDELKRQVKLFEENEILKNITNSVSNMIVILNKERQIIYANRIFLDFLNLSESSPIIGKRPGEAASCLHADSTEGGCGTTEFCRKCGAVNAILESQEGNQSVKECRIITTDNEALDLKVTATPYDSEGEMFTIFAINDISHEKRRQTLERVFFHDVLNSAGGITGLSDLLKEMKNPSEVAEIAQMINRSASKLVEEIEAQRNLIAAEKDDFILNYSFVESLNVLQDLSTIYSQHDVITDKHLKTDPKSENFKFETDAILIRRILGNMIKNALEASLPDETVTLGCYEKEKNARFTVHNSTYIDREVQLQLFKRSFSTKGAGRGIGTYSMKLFGEKYLKGKVGFESSVAKGTTFFLEVPTEKP